MENSIKKLLKISACTAGILLSICVLVTSPKDFDDWVSLIGKVVAVTSLITITYIYHVWRYNPLEKCPVLCKSYDGVITPTCDSVPRKATITIKQNLISVNITLQTEESKSISISSCIDKVYNETQLVYTYRNNPNAEVRERSQIHYGTVILCIDNVNEISGQYFTDRKTTGDMKFQAKEKIK